MENEKYKINYDNPSFIDKTIVAHTLDIPIIDKPNKITYIMDVTVPSDHNNQSKYTERIER